MQPHVNNLTVSRRMRELLAVFLWPQENMFHTNKINKTWILKKMEAIIT